MDVITMTTQSAPLLRLKKQYNKCCCVCLSILLLGLLAAVVCNYAIGSAYLGFLVSLAIYLAAAAYQIILTRKAFSALEKASLEESQKMELRKYTFRMCALVIGCIAVQTAACSPLVTLPWAFSQRIIAIGWLEAAWLPCVITTGVCAYLWWFLDTTAIIKGYWKREQTPRREKHTRRRYLLFGVIALLAVLLTHLLFNCIPMDTLAGGNTYRSWADFAEFMESPQDEWGNTVDRWLDGKTQLYAKDGTTVLCEYAPMNFSVDHIVYSENEDLLPVTVFTNRQMQNAQATRKNINLFLCALYIAIPLADAAFYFWKEKGSQHQQHKHK